MKFINTNNKYKLISLISQFIIVDKLIRKQKTATDKFKIWEELFEKPNKELMKTYFNWANKKHGKRIFAKYNQIYKIKAIEKNEKYVKRNISTIIKNIEKLIGAQKEKITIVLNVGFYQTNGFVDKYKKQYTTFINLEDYDDTITLKVFLTHELAHNIQLFNNPSIYYWNKKKERSFQNHLLLEGFATFITKRALKTNSAIALWGNYLTEKQKNKFIKWCENNKNQLKFQTLKLLNTKKLSDFDKYFGGEKPKGCPFIRTGYYLGLDFVEYLIDKKQKTIKEIMLLKGNKLKSEIKKYLEDTK